jgi:hypothetical protein
MLQLSGLSAFRVMQADHILKHGASPKSQMIRGNLLTSEEGGRHFTKSRTSNFILALALILATAFTACEKDPFNNPASQEPALPKTEAEVFGMSEYNLALRDFTLVVGKAMNVKQLTFVAELTPLITTNGKVNVRHLLGIRYTFKKQTLN